MSKWKSITLVLPGLALLGACDPGPVAIEDEVAELELAAAEADPAIASPSPATHEPDPGAAKRTPAPPMPGAKAAFGELVQLIEDEYVEGPLTEDALWTGAMEGVLARLIQLGNHPINTLLTPAALSELTIGTKGQLVGIGIMIDRVADVVVIRETISGSPAERASLQPGDRILGIDGTRVRDLDLTQVVERIRGQEGTPVELFVQRDTDEWIETITRGVIEVPSVASRMLGPTTGYVRVTTFASDTATELDGQLAKLEQEGMRSLVLDLRACPGGLLDSSIAFADRFLAPGETILTVEDRHGAQERLTASESHPWEALPLVVLIDGHTASSAEIVADALRTHGHARLVGEATLGKHTVEAIHELGSGWAVKLSIRRFITAGGAREQGKGVEPDVRIAGRDGHEVHDLAAIDPAADAPLATAIELLRTP